MELLAALRTQVRANRLANHRLHAAMGALSRDAYEQRRTSFFASLQHTLEHILAVDRYYLAALHGEADMERQWDDSPKGVSFEELAQAQANTDQRFIAHVDSLQPSDLDAEVVMDRGNDRLQRDLRGHVIAHVIAHQIHHRGQAHAMLAGTSVKPPQLDEFLMPSEAHLRERDMSALRWSEAQLFSGSPARPRDTRQARTELLALRGKLKGTDD